eukprot:TRINITY_DN39205_c0_g1_i1.p2 TRINITY_DN39205_c0_g1~~TRINITY_DN39205_c0_g1_i1.p2  ORF type:complete len:103 (+),score=5.40 TRINITY_DN39205_c0_g1_i1:279-587(+)
MRAYPLPPAVPICRFSAYSPSQIGDEVLNRDFKGIQNISRDKGCGGLLCNVDIITELGLLSFAMFTSTTKQTPLCVCQKGAVGSFQEMYGEASDAPNHTAEC